MPFVVTGKCIQCKYADCVEVCPTDAFYSGENMMVINPDECIDCGVCEPECPIEAIKNDEELEEGEEKWVDINIRFSATWPNITKSHGPMPEAEAYADVPVAEKESAFSENPGKGDE